MKEFLYSAGVLAVMLLVVFSAYYVTKFVAVRARTGFGRPRYFKLLDRFNISRDKTLVLISVGQNAYLIGFANQSATLIDTVRLSDIQSPSEERPPSGPQFSFDSGMRDLSFRGFMKRARENSHRHDIVSGTGNGGGDGDESNGAE